MPNFKIAYPEKFINVTVFYNIQLILILFLINKSNNPK